VQDAELNILQLQVAEYVVRSFESPNSPVYPYHNLQHTRNVVSHSEEMANHYRLNATDRFIVTTAAWFHDIGHLYGEMRGHEERGARIMEQWMSAQATVPILDPERDLGRNLEQWMTTCADGLSPANPGPASNSHGLAPAIRNCILATKFPSHPANLLEQIICDADTYHLGTDLFRQTDPLVRKEMAQRFGDMPAVNWKQKTLAFLRQHVFFTDYCQALLNKKKQENIAWFEAQPESDGQLGA
jgi:predicted metal-dependent HD superfamily phosphohydrolase